MISLTPAGTLENLIKELSIRLKGLKAYQRMGDKVWRKDTNEFYIKGYDKATINELEFLETVLDELGIKS